MVSQTAVTSVVGLLLCSAATSHAWGRAFNRFSPEVLADFGYSGGNRHYYSPIVQPQSSALRDKAELIEELLEEDEETKAHCRGRRCFANEQCCSSYLCVEVDSDNTVSGSCMPKFVRREGDSCSTSADCGSSLTCVEQASGGKRCEKHVVGNKAYYEDCRMTTECDVTRGLCCQLLRRHRQSPRKACLYFSDPLMCIGHVPVEEVKAKVEHMASEKRITGHIDDLKHLTN